MVGGGGSTGVERGASMHGEAGVFGVAWRLSPMKSFTKLSQIWIAAGAMDWR